jgi:hypothetical protein
MTNDLVEVARQFAHHRVAIAIGIPLLGSTLALASSILTPRGKAKGLITGAYMLLASLGAACLLFALAAGLAGASRAEIGGLLVVGITLTAIMGIFTPEIIREYQHFEGRKLAAAIFRRS